MLRRFLVLASLVTALAAGTALADATPVQLILLYMPNVSNTDTPSATGIAELVMPEGEVRIKTADLPRLEDDKHYVAWVVNSDDNLFDRLGAFNTAQSTGAVAFETVLADAIPDKHWNLLLVTIEDSATPERPSSQHSIAGLFPSADNAPLPILLPNTGGDPAALPALSCQPLAVSCQLSRFGRADWLIASGLVALVASVTFAAGYAAGRGRPVRH